MLSVIHFSFLFAYLIPLFDTTVYHANKCPSLIQIFFFVILISFVRGDQYAIALALLDEGKVVLGVLACPNLPLSSISNQNGSSSGDQVGALFSATIGCGAEVESLDGSPPQKVIALSI